MVALRRAAAFDLFRACALGPPPRLLWRFVDGDDDVGGGVDRFLRAIGHGRSGPDGPLLELQRAEGRIARMPGAAADAARDDIMSGDPARRRAALAAAATVQAAAAPWPADLIGSAAGGDPAVAALLVEAGDALEEHRELRDALARHWPERWLTGPEADALRDRLGAFEEAELRLLDALSGPASGPASGRAGAAAAGLDDLRRINDELADAERAARAAGAWTANAAAPGSGDAVAADLARLDADLLAAPGRKAALAAWGAFRWRHHPDRPGLDDRARRVAERAADAADRALDRIERSAGGGNRPTP